MKSSTNKNTIAASSVFIYGKGLFRGCIISLILFFAGALVITYTDLGENLIPALTSAVMVLSIAYSAVYVSANIKKIGWVHGSLTGLIYFFILMILSIIFVPGYAFNQISLYKIVLSMGAGAVGGMIGINIK